MKHWSAGASSYLNNPEFVFGLCRFANELIMSVLVVGSIALDTVKTPVEEHADQIGGSACYAAVGASFFAPVNLVGIVGEDFPQSEFKFWKTRGIDASGVVRAKAKTFRWSGEY